MTGDPARLLRLATYSSTATAVLLIVAKLVAWLLTGSVSVLASLVDSLMDAGASLVNLLAVHYSLMPPDDEHRFGHGKAESLAGLAQATFIAGSALFLILQAIDRLMNPRPLESLGIGVAVIVFAIVATVALLTFQRYVIRHTGSTAIRADALHYGTDLLTNASIIVALILAGLGWPGADPIFAMVIGVYILYSAWTIGLEAFHQLMDRELSSEVQARIREIVSGHPAVRGMHGLRTRQSGRMELIQLHVELDGNIPLRDAHAVTDELDKRLLEAFPNADIIIHQDPYPPPATDAGSGGDADADRAGTERAEDRAPGMPRRPS